MKIFVTSMKLKVSAFIFCVLILALSDASGPIVHAGADDSGVVTTSTAEGRLTIFDDVWETVQERYYDPSFNGVDWHASRTTFRLAAAKAGNSREFYEVIRKMLSALRDAHTRVYAPDEKFDWWNPRFITLGFTIREVEGLAIVIQVDKESDAERLGIKPGDVITRINDVPAKDYIKQRIESPGLASDTSSRFRAFANALEGPAGSVVKIDWLSKGGRTKSAPFTRFWNQKRLGFSSRRVDDLAVIKIDAFTQSVALEFTKALPRMVSGVQGIVLDLRSNGGGDAEAMADVVAPFLEDGTGLGKFVDRSGASFELHTYMKRLWPSTSAVRLPMVVLTSESTSSAAEIMAAVLQTKRNARLVGSTTCGCVLAIRNRHALPDGGVLDVSEFDYHTADGIRLEGRGVKPNEVTTLKREDLYAGRDRTLEVAKSFFKQNSK